MERDEDPAATFFPGEDSPDLYAALGLAREPAPSQNDIKLAYRRAALQYHPDKQTDAGDNGAAATRKFQQIGFAYSVLRDDARRTRYDRTGRTDAPLEGGLDKSEDEWREFFKDLWSGEVSARSIDEFKAKYQGSEEEKGDVLAAYDESEGDIDAVMSSVMCSTDVDEERFVALINDAIEAGQVKSTKAWRAGLKDKKARARRRAQASKEAKEAEEYAKELGVHDKLFAASGSGSGKGSTKNKKSANASGGGGQQGDEDALRALIQSKQASRMDSLMSSLEAKYGSGKKPPKKRKSGEGADGRDDEKASKRRYEEPSEEEFLRARAKVDAARNGGGGSSGKSKSSSSSKSHR